MNRSCSRRGVLHAAFAAGCASAVWAQPVPAATPLGLGFSLYGMKAVPPREALVACADLGYDCVEWVALAGWPTAPEQLGAAERRELAARLQDNPLRLSAVMENLPLLVDSSMAAQQRDRLRRAGQLARDLSPQSTPLLETVLGGRPAEWLQVREKMAEALYRWAEVAAAEALHIAIKAHVGGAAHRPEHIAWLLRQVSSPQLRAAYDYSHFQLREIPLEASVQELAGDMGFVHVKDSLGTLDQFQFVLPGAGTIPYPTLLRQLVTAGYRGDVVVEVSGQLHNKPDYEPLAAARQSIAVMQAAWRDAGLNRR